MAGKLKTKLRLSDCDTCNGAGEKRGIYHLLVCASCNGLGEVNAETGEALEDQQIIDRLRERNRKLLWRIQQLARERPEPLSAVDRQKQKYQ